MTDFKNISQEFEKSIERLTGELKNIRTGRAHTGLVEHIIVDAYGTPTPLQHLASLSIPDPRTILISPWDKTLLKEVEKALSLARQGLQSVNDGSSLRVVLPQMTEENRKALVKIIGIKQEDARRQIRGVRDTAREKIVHAEKEKEMTQDDKYALLEELDEMTRKITDQIDSLCLAKEKEVTSLTS